MYPLKIQDDFSLSFRLEGYPLPMPGAEIASAYGRFGVPSFTIETGRPSIPSLVNIVRTSDNLVARFVD